MNPLVCLLFYYTTPLSSFLVLEDPFYNLLSQSPIFPISSSSSSYCFICKNRLWLTFANGSFFHHFQFSSNLFQYSCSYFFFPHLYNNFAVYLPSNPLLNVFLFSSASCRFASSSSALLYSFSNSSTSLLAFLRFSLLSQMFFSTVHPFHHTRYFSLPCTHLLFIIFSISHSSSPSITMVLCQTIIFGNINDIQNLIIIINSS